MRKVQRLRGETPEDTTPHIRAHIGGNQVIGLRSSKTSRAAGGGVNPVETADCAMGKDYAHAPQASNQIDTLFVK